MLAFKHRLLAIALLASFGSTTLVAQQNRNKGAVVGGAAGAVIGGIVGHQNNETPEGALIGGAVGAIAGGVIGNAKDKQVARERAYQHQIYHQQRQLDSQSYQMNQQARRAVSISDVITMSRSGLGDGVIIGHIESNGVQRRPEVSDILTMHQNGVSEGVIAAYERASSGAVVTRSYGAQPYQQRTYTSQSYQTYPSQTYYPPGSVIVHEEVRVQPSYPVYQPTYVQPRYYAPPPAHYRRGY